MTNRLVGCMLVIGLLIRCVDAGIGLPGDYNRDGVLDHLDANFLVDQIPTFPATPAQGDLNGDSLVDAADFTVWRQIAGAANLPSGNPYLLGDGNLSGAVDVRDFMIWNMNKFTSNVTWTDGDYMVDNVVDASDYIVWRDRSFMGDVDGTATYAIPTISVTPELGDQVPDIRYNSETGLLGVFIDGGALVALIINGPNASNEGLAWADDTTASGVSWNQAFFDGAEQWYATQPFDGKHSAAQYTIADYGPGLGSNSFGEVWVAVSNGNIYKTSVLVIGCPGDLDDDQSVGQPDLGILLASFGVDGDGDLDGDNDTDQADLGILLANFGANCLK